MRRTRKVRVWTARSDVTGRVVAVVRALNARAAVKLAGKQLARKGLAPMAISVDAQLVGRRGRTIDPLVVESLHESAHAISGALLKLDVRYVSMEDEAHDGDGGVCVLDAPAWLMRHLRRPRGAARPPMPRSSARRGLVHRYAVQSMSGLAAESIVLADAPMRYGVDWIDAARCGQMLGHRGVHARAFVYVALREAETLLRAHWGAVRVLAREILRRSTRRRVTGSEVARIVRSARRSRQARTSRSRGSARARPRGARTATRAS